MAGDHAEALSAAALSHRLRDVTAKKLALFNALRAGDRLVSSLSFLFYFICNHAVCVCV
jgi:hypothetical protein